MEIRPLNKEDLYHLIAIDREVFDRLEPRSATNLKGLLVTDAPGCYALWDKDKIVGYSFCRSMGSEGYLGPVGILPEYQGQGWGKKLISHSLKYLKSRCQVIGLEVRPEAGENIGLYHQIGFRNGFPSYILQVPEHINSGKLCHVESFLDMEPSQVELYIQMIDNWTQENLGGLSFKRDIVLTQQSGGLILVAQKSGEPYGFLASFQNVFPHLWGVIEPHRYCEEILMSLLSNYRKRQGPGEILLEVNTRYDKLVDILLNKGFKIKKSVNRMILQGYSGSHLEKSSDLVFRSWHA